MPVVINEFDSIPHDQRTGLRLSGWVEQVVNDVTLRTNVKNRVDGRSVPYWPVLVGDTWSPSWVTVTE